jgi:hypothetical protein
MSDTDRDALEKVRERAAVQFMKVAREFRAAHTGDEAEALFQQAKKAFDAAGVQFTDDQVRAYVRSVSSDRPFMVRLDVTMPRSMG